jgi:site-specific DNA-methyltransferase (adenine-specific)
MNIVDIKLDDITPYWRNPRDNDETVPALVKSIERYGFRVPLILDRQNTIISGHTRFRAVRELGWDTVPCVIADIDDKKARELRIIDNRIHELTEWNEDELQKELDSIINLSETLNFFEGTLDGVFGIATEDMSMELDVEDVADEEPKEDVLVICPVCMEMTKVIPV